MRRTKAEVSKSQKNKQDNHNDNQMEDCPEYVLKY